MMFYHATLACFYSSAIKAQGHSDPHWWVSGPVLLLTLSTLMSTTVDILSFYKHMYNQFLKVKYASNLETQIDVLT